MQSAESSSRDSFTSASVSSVFSSSSSTSPTLEFPTSSTSNSGASLAALITSTTFLPRCCSSLFPFLTTRPSSFGEFLTKLHNELTSFSILLVKQPFTCNLIIFWLFSRRENKFSLIGLLSHISSENPPYSLSPNNSKSSCHCCSFSSASLKDSFSFEST